MTDENKPTEENGSPQEPAPTPPERVRNRYTLLLAATILAATALLIFGLYGTWSEHDKAVSTVTLVLSFAGFFLAALQTYPGIVRHSTGAWRAINFAVVVIFLASSLPAMFLVLQDPVIRIGVSLPLSGPDKQDGMAMLQAVRMAVKDERNNRIDNYTIDIVAFDDHDAANSINFYSDTGTDLERPGKLDDIVADVHLAGVLGPFNSGSALLEIPVLSEAGVPLVSPANTLGCLTGAEKCRDVVMPQNSTYLRIAANDAVRARALTEYFKGLRAGARIKAAPQAVVYSDKSPFGDGFAEEFSRAWRSAYPGSAQPPTIPVSTGIADAQNQKKSAQVVLFAGTGSDGITLYQAMQKNKKNSDVTFVAAATIMNRAFTAGLAGGIRGKLYAITPFPYHADDEIVQKFRSRYATEYDGNQPTPYAVAIYDAARALISSIRAAVAAGYRPPVVDYGPIAGQKTLELRRNVMQNLRNLNRPGGVTYSGAMGPFSFDAKGDATFDGTSSSGTASIYQYIDDAAADPTRGWRLVK